MATATRATTYELPADLRARLDERWTGEMIEPAFDNPKGIVRQVVTEVATPLIDAAAWTLEGGHAGVWEPFDADHAPAALWTDLRPSEAVFLRDLVSAAMTQAVDRCYQVILEELEEAARIFVDQRAAPVPA